MAEAAARPALPNRPDTYPQRRALHALADLLAPVVHEADLHLVDRADLHFLVQLVADALDRAADED